MDAVIGFTGADYVLIAADGNSGRSIIMYKRDEDKIIPLGKSMLLGAAGPTGDRTQFGEYIQKNVALYALRNDIELTTHGAAAYIRNQLADALRSNPFQVNLLLGGFEEKKGPSLYYMDYLASMHKLDFGAHGYASNFCLSVMDRFYKRDMTLEEGKDLLRKCIAELRLRFMVDMSSWTIKISNKDGVSEIKLD